MLFLSLGLKGLKQPVGNSRLDTTPPLKYTYLLCGETKKEEKHKGVVAISQVYGVKIIARVSFTTASDWLFRKRSFWVVVKFTIDRISPL